MAAVDRILTRIQHALAAAGARGTTGLVQSFRTMDSRGDGRLAYEEFSRSLKAAGVRLSEQDVRTLFISFDKHGNNQVEIREFVHALAGEVSPRRRALIERVFRNIAGNEDAASLADVGACFRADRHPDVERGASTPGKVLSDLLEALRESNTLANGRVTRQGLVDFYRLSSAFVSDNDFEAVMEAVWVPRTSKLPRGKQRTLAEATFGGNDGGKQRPHALVETLRQSLAASGVRGIVSLGRRFRANDHAKMGTLSQPDFCRCVREAAVRLDDGELRALFDAFDVDHSGRISYDDFMRTLRGELGQQRRGLVERAFDLLDADKSGAVEPRDIVERFDSSRHPDVVEGRRSRDEVYREFLDTFDVGGVVDGKVTRSEFEEYYSNVSASVDSDDFFEVMMRNVWHIPRGDAWPPKAAKLRLLVTHADGSQSVEDVADDFGLELPRDRLEIMRRLRACGIDAVDVSLHNPEKDSSVGKATPPHLTTTLGAVATAHSQLSSEDQESTLRGDAGNCQRGTQRPLSAKTKFLWTAGVESVVERLRFRLSALGRHGYHQLKRAFAAADVNADGFVSLAEFIEAVNNRIGLNCSRKDAEAVFKVFDEERTLTIDYVEFMRFVAPPMLPSRSALVRRAFDAMDTEGTGAVPPDVIARRYDASAHVDVRAGVATAQDAYASFMEHFDIGSERDGLVTLGDFEAYHALLSANEPDDLSFEALVRDLWRIRATLTDSPPAVNDAGKIRLRVVCANGRVTVEELLDEYGLRDAKGKLCEREAVRRLQLRGVNAATAEEIVDELPPASVKVNNQLRPPVQSEVAEAERQEPAPVFREPLKATERRAVELAGSGAAKSSAQQADESGSARLAERRDERATSVAPLATTTRYDAAPAGCTQQSPALRGTGTKIVKSAWGPSSIPQTSGDGAAAAGVAALALSLASQLRCRGQQGFVSLRRSLKSVADDSGFVTLASFKSAARATGLDASDAELRALFSFIDSDSAGFAKAEACVNAIRPRMSSRRSAIVDLAFKRIDVDSVGAIAPSVLAAGFDPSRAPEVLAGRQTKQAAYDSFLQSFDVDPDRAHGQVTKHDFFEFHADLSAAVEKDDVFSDYVRNVWRLSPLDVPNDVSASRDSSRHITVVARRVDGRQTVERLPASLRGTINLDDADDLVAALREHCKIAASSAVAVKDDQAVLSNEELSDAVGTDTTRPCARSIAHVGAAHVAAAAELISRRFEDRPRGRKMVGGLASRSTGGQALPGNSTQPRRSTARPVAFTEVPPIDPGVAAIASRLRAEVVVQGGLRGIVALERKLRAASASISSSCFRRQEILSMSYREEIGLPQGGSRHLTLEELSGILRECEIHVQGHELRAMFAACDREGDGTVDWGDWLSLIRPPLSKDRLEAVRAAWCRMFGDAKRVSPQLVAEHYNASLHPEVVSGRATCETQYRLFLDTFDVGEESPGFVTATEFEAYHANVSATVSSDEYFTVLLSVWRPSDDAPIPKDEAAPAPAPKSIPLSVATRRAKQKGRALEPALETDAAGGSVGRTRYSVAEALSSTSPVDTTRREATSLVDRRKGGRLLRVPKIGTETELRDVVGIERLLLDVRRQLAKHGARGIIGLSRKFRIMDDDGSKCITIAEFKKAVRELGLLELTDAEIRLIFEAMDVNASGSIDYEEFLKAVRGDMNERRKLLVRRAFDLLDTDGSGVVEPAEVASRYDPNRHPDVIACRREPDSVYREFLETFDVGGDQDGRVTAREFEHYYSNVSASIDNDDYFELMIRNTWHIPGGEGSCANTANLRVLVTHSDGSQTVECVNSDLGLQMPRDQIEILHRIQAQGVVDAVSVSSVMQDASDDPQNGGHTGTSLDGSFLGQAEPRPRTFREVSQTRAAGGGGRINESRHTGKKMHGYLGHGGMFTSQISLAHGPDRPATAPTHRRRMLSPNDVFYSTLGSDMREKKAQHEIAAAGRPAAEIGASSDAMLSVGSLGVALKRRDAKAVIDRVRLRLMEKGLRGIAALARNLRGADDSHAKTLSAAEFAKVMCGSGIDLDQAEVSAIFAAFDRGGAGVICYDEFLRTVRGTMNARRTKLVDAAFRQLDCNNTGFVDVDGIVGKFHAAKHPDVISGAATSNEVLQEFLDTFEVGGEQVGKVSKGEFHEYYSNVSASVENDDYFELIVRNAWHMDVGFDATAETAKHRLLVTRADGTQTVESIDVEDGLDSRQVLQRLQRQGIDAVSVKLYGTTKSKPSKTSNTYRTTLTLA